jgi:hypothetical protein
VRGEPLDPGAGLQVTASPLTPPIQPQPQVKEWIELFDKGVINREELRHQLALVTANSLSSPALQDPLPELAEPGIRSGPAQGVAATRPGASQQTKPPGVEQPATFPRR